jgi:hypothetical protein
VVEIVYGEAYRPDQNVLDAVEKLKYNIRKL